MAEPPIPSIFWTLGSRILCYIRKKISVDVTFEQTERNPSTKVVRDVALVKYQLIIRTHGLPKKCPHVTFSKVKGMGQILKKTVSPSNIGDVDGSLRLKLYTNELPVESEVALYVDFEVKVDPERLVNKSYLGSDLLDRAHSEMEVLCSNSFNFPLEQVPIAIRKDETEQLSSARILIINRRSHNVISELDPIAIRKGDEYVKWYTSFQPDESVLFKVVATWV